MYGKDKRFFPTKVPLDRTNVPLDKDKLNK